MALSYLPVVITKDLDFHLEQVQDFTPTPMTVSTETWYTGYDPYTLEPVFSAKTPREKLAQRQFFFWYKPEERQSIERELRRIGRPDLIKKLYNGAPYRGHVHYDGKAIGSTPTQLYDRNKKQRNDQHHQNKQTRDKKSNEKRKSFNPNFTPNGKYKGRRR